MREPYLTCALRGHLPSGPLRPDGRRCLDSKQLRFQLPTQILHHDCVDDRIDAESEIAGQLRIDVDPGATQNREPLEQSEDHGRDDPGEPGQCELDHQSLFSLRLLCPDLIVDDHLPEED